jgi:hypothetical protein
MNVKNLFILCCVLFIMESNAENILQFKSHVKQTTMIELYSSQGCSSCPPAERWMSKFINDSNLWTDTVPIVFHVDYWNDIGWVDPFSNSSNSERQREYHRQGKIRSVYTPGIIINGKEWRGGQYFLAEKDPGVLQASLTGRLLEVKFENKENLVLHVSILGTGIKTDVTSGENSDKVLQEDFIALSHQKIESDKGMWQLELPEIKNKVALRYGLAVWVSYPGMNSPIQSTGGWLPKDMFGS